MRDPEGFVTRRGLFAAGAGSLGLGVVLYVVGILQTSQAIAATFGCYGGYPVYNYPPGCAEAQAALTLWQFVTSVGGVVGVVGFILLILGLVLPPEGARPGPPYMPMYPPPVYAPQYPPPTYAPPQEPRTPPPGSP